MSGSNLSVKITADVVELQTKFAIARAEVNGLTSEMNKLARATAAGTIDAAGSARLTQLAGDMLHARSEAGEYAAALERAGVSASGFASRMEGGEINVARTATAFRHLIESVGSGNIGGADIALLHLGHSVLELGPAALAAVGATAALTGGLGYLGYRAIEASKALDSMKLGAEFAGNFDTTREQLKALTEELAKAQNVSRSEAEKIVANFARIPEATTPEIQALTAIISDYARMTGEESDKASESLAKLFNPKLSAEELARQIGGVTQAQINQAAAADRSGNASAVVAEKIALQTDQIARSKDSLVQATASLANWHNWLNLARSAIIDQASPEQIHARLIEQDTQAAQANIAALKARIAAMQATPASPGQTLKTGVEVADKENPVAKQVEETKAKLAELTAALAVAKQEGDQVSVERLNAGLQKTREELSALQFGPVVERMREQMGQLAATWDGTQSGLLAKQEQVAQASLASTRTGSKEYLAIQTEIAGMEVRARQAAGEQIIADARTQVSAINAMTGVGASQRLAQERDVWSALLAGDRLTAAQRVDVQRDYNNAVAGLEREQRAQAATIARQDADTDIAIARANLEAKKDFLDQDVAASANAAAQKLAAMRELTAQEYALNLQELQNELATLQDEPAEYDRVYNQIRELKAKLVQDLAGLDRIYQAESKRYAAEQATEWHKAVGEITSAEATMVSDLLSRRKSMSQSLLGIAQQTVQKEITNDLQAMTTRLLMANTEEARQKALDESGYLYHLAITHLGTGATQAAQSAQTAATVAGNTARLTSTASTAAAGKAIQSATAGKSVMSDAAQAFSGTYASASKIPYVGWILAPIAAAGAFAAVAGYESLASLDTGAYNVPQDMLANIHAGEVVMPRPFAEEWRAAQSGGRDDDDGGGGTTHNHYWSVNSTDAASFKKMIEQMGHRDAIVGVLANHFHSRLR